MPKDYRPHFDVAAMEAANVEPTITIGSFTYVGNLHSAPEWFRWNERIQEIKKRQEAKDLRGVEVLAFYHEYFRSIFPAGWFRRGVPFWAPDVADSLLAQPFGFIEEAFQRFFARQARANGVTIELPSQAVTSETTESPRIPGTDSSDSTPGAAPTASEARG